MTTNDAAERLRAMWRGTARHEETTNIRSAMLDAALAAERRATVERCREWVRSQGKASLETAFEEWAEEQT